MNEQFNFQKRFVPPPPPRKKATVEQENQEKPEKQEEKSVPAEAAAQCGDKNVAAPTSGGNADAARDLEPGDGSQETENGVPEKGVPAAQNRVPASAFPKNDSWADRYLELQKEFSQLEAQMKIQAETLEILNKKLVETQAILEKKSAESDKFKDALTHSIADFDNYRRRTSEETPKNILYGKISLAKEIVPVVDNFKLAIDSIRKNSPEATTILEGVEMIEKQLISALGKHEIVEIAPKKGDLFNPQEHEALSAFPSDEVPEDHILFIQRTGFKLGTQLIRAAAVVVSKKI